MMRRPPVPFKLELNIGAFNIPPHMADAIAVKLFNMAQGVRNAATSTKAKYPFQMELAAQLYSLAGDAFNIAATRAAEDDKHNYHKMQSKQSYTTAEMLLEQARK